MMQGSKVTCCGFAHAADDLRCLCHFLVLGPGEWYQSLTTALCFHGGGGGGTIVSCWCLQRHLRADYCVHLLFLTKWVVLSGLGVSVGIASSVFGLTHLAADNADSDDNDNDA
eukprot:12510326-Ditylum_brightwellii.AAC.1